jgi:hypothetical protein
LPVALKINGLVSTALKQVRVLLKDAPPPRAVVTEGGHAPPRPNAEDTFDDGNKRPDATGDSLKGGGKGSSTATNGYDESAGKPPPGT